MVAIWFKENETCYWAVKSLLVPDILYLLCISELLEPYCTFHTANMHTANMHTAESWNKLDSYGPFSQKNSERNPMSQMSQGPFAIDFQESNSVML